MPLIPEWAPNIHPLVVHFPIALVFVALVADAAALFVRRGELRAVAAGLYTLAALGALAAFFTGRQAADSVEVNAQAVSTLTRHADLALYAVWGLSLYAVLRIGLLWWKPRYHRTFDTLVMLLGLGGVVLVWQTAERGAALVFAHGVGVQTPTATGDPFGPFAAAEQAQPASILRATEAGGWAWHPVPGQELPSDFEALEGDASALQAATSTGDSLAAFTLDGGPLLLVAGSPRAGIQVEALLDLSTFDGTAAIVHHVQDAGHYDFLAFDGTQVVQGRQDGEQQQFFGRAPYHSAEPFRVRITAHGTHFYGYVNGQSLVHGHGNAPPAGRAGLYFEGQGTVRVGGLVVTPID